jgi:hypothetical protein
LAVHGGGYQVPMFLQPRCALLDGWMKEVRPSRSQWGVIVRLCYVRSSVACQNAAASPTLHAYYILSAGVVGGAHRSEPWVHRSRFHNTILHHNRISFILLFFQVRYQESPPKIPSQIQETALQCWPGSFCRSKSDRSNTYARSTVLHSLVVPIMRRRVEARLN